MPSGWGSASEPGAWLVDSQSIATPQEPPTQFADSVARGDWQPGHAVRRRAAPVPGSALRGGRVDAPEIDSDMRPSCRVRCWR